MRCSDVMWSQPACVAPEETALSVIRKIASADVGALPVVDDDGSYLGMVTERAICRQIIAEELDPRLTRIALVVDRSVPVVDPDDPVSVALKRMDEANIRWLPVILAGKVAGLVGARDIRAAARRDDAEHIHTFTEAALLH